MIKSECCNTFQFMKKQMKIERSITRTLPGVHCGLGMLMILSLGLPFPVYSYCCLPHVQKDCDSKFSLNLTASRRQAFICIRLDFLLHTSFFFIFIDYFINHFIGILQRPGTEHQRLHLESLFSLLN